jgi:hypothetical protein
MSRQPIGDKATTERVHRHREQIRLRRAEAEHITQKYFGGRPPLSQKERRRLVREMAWLLDAE